MRIKLERLAKFYIFGKNRVFSIFLSTGPSKPSD